MLRTSFVLSSGLVVSRFLSKLTVQGIDFGLILGNPGLERLEQFNGSAIQLVDKDTVEMAFRFFVIGEEI